MDLYGQLVATKRAGELKSRHSQRWSPHILLMSQGTMEKTLWLRLANQHKLTLDASEVLDQLPHLELVLAQGLPAARWAFLGDEVGDKGLGSDGRTRRGFVKMPGRYHPTSAFVCWLLSGITGILRPPQAHYAQCWAS